MSTVKAPTLELDSLTLSNFNLSSPPNQISADWNVSMNFTNVDTHGYFEFSNIKVLIYYDKKIVGVTNLMSFDMSPKDPPMHVGGEFSSRLSSYIDDTMITHITHSVNLTSTLIFNVEFSALVKKTYRGFWGTDWWDPYLWVYNCENVELIFGSSDASKANILNGSGKCKKVSLPPWPS
ncbi:uncharacterized protein LOC141691027 [Apium graveolens]|uniref:uncharacterized protein LOC141691027 n=1 Tax=Apium graveolens TaxID=4045 RepID=UPI003D790947